MESTDNAATDQNTDDGARRVAVTLTRRQWGQIRLALEFNATRQMSREGADQIRRLESMIGMQID